MPDRINYGVVRSDKVSDDTPNEADIRKRQLEAADAEPPPNKKARAAPVHSEYSAEPPPKKKARVAPVHSEYSKDLFITPEFTPPERSLDDSTASAANVTENDNATPQDGDKYWQYGDETSMSPYWAVRRLRHSDIVHDIGRHIKQHQTNSDNTQPPGPPPEANCTLQEFHVDSFVYGTITNQPARIQTVYGITLEAISNNKRIPKGAELILQIPETHHPRS